MKVEIYLTKWLEQMYPDGKGSGYFTPKNVTDFAEYHAKEVNKNDCQHNDMVPDNESFCDCNEPKPNLYPDIRWRCSICDQIYYR